jgi:hypothetical protein
MGAPFGSHETVKPETMRCAGDRPLEVAGEPEMCGVDPWSQIIGRLSSHWHDSASKVRQVSGHRMRHGRAVVARAARGPLRSGASNGKPKQPCSSLGAMLRAAAISIKPGVPAMRVPGVFARSAAC